MDSTPAGGGGEAGRGVTVLMFSIHDGYVKACTAERGFRYMKLNRGLSQSESTFPLSLFLEGQDM